MMMKNDRKHPQPAGPAGCGKPEKIWGGVVLLGLLAMLFSFEKIGETAESNINTITISGKSETNNIEISRKMIEDIIFSFLDNNIPWDKNRVSVQLVQASENLFLPDRPYTYKVIPPVRTRYLGNVPLCVVFEVQGQASLKAWATVKIGVETDVVIVQKPLNRNQTIGKDDVTVASMDMADLPSNYISAPDDVVGKKTLRTMNPKEVFRTDIVELPPMVRRNDRVSIVAESESLRITAAGEVKENGGKGDRVKVVNLNSNKEIFARVVDPKTVRVEF